MPYDYIEQLHKNDEETYYKFLASALKENNDILSEIEDKQPYLYRATNKPEAAVEYVQEKLVGGSVAVNQLVQNGDFESTSGWSVNSSLLSINNNKCIVTSTGVGYPGIVKWSIFNNNAVYNHKLYCSCKITNNTSKDVTMAICKTSNYNQIFNGHSVGSGKTGYSQSIGNINVNEDTSYIFIRQITASANIGESFTVENVQIIDLTQMFGTAIADRAYAMEQATAGSGIAWLKSYGFFTDDYYAYNTGELKSVECSGKKVEGNNLVKVPYALAMGGATSGTTNGIEWEILDNGNTVFLKGGKTATANVRLNVYSIINYPSTKRYFAPFIGKHVIANGCPSGGNSSTYFLNFQGFVTDGISIQDMGSGVDFTISDFSNYSTIQIVIAIQSGYIIPANGLSFKPMIKLADADNLDYEPYTSTTYPFASNLTLRGIPKLDANNKLYYDGDIYESSGKVTRKYEIVDLGSLDWTYDNTNAVFTTTLSDGKGVTQSAVGIRSLFVCGKYFVDTIDGSSGHSGQDKICFQGFSSSLICYVRIKDSSYTDAATFKTAMSGVYLIYELATPTTDTAASYQNPQIIHENGTEEFIDTRDYPLPVGHDTEYYTQSDEKFVIPPLPDTTNSYVLYHDNDGYQWKKSVTTSNDYTDSEKNKLASIDTLSVELDLLQHAIVVTQDI